MDIKLSQTGNRPISWPLPHGHQPGSRTTYQVGRDGRPIGLVAGVDVLDWGPRTEHIHRIWWMTDLDGVSVSRFHRHTPPGEYFETRELAVRALVIWEEERRNP